LEKNNLYITEIIDKCTNCGNCRTVCPVFKITGEEIYSTRGRINLVKGYLSGELKTSKELREKLFVCLNCGQCLEFCPADVEYSLILKNAKSRIISRNKIFDIKRSILEGIFSFKPSTSDLFFMLLRKCGNLLFKNNSLNYFGKIIFRLAGTNLAAKFPEIPINNFFNMDVRHETKNDRGIRIALFTGCGGKHLYPECTDNFVKIMRAQGIEILIPKNQVCCGNPLSYKGLLKSAGRNLNSNIKAFNCLLDIKLIVSLCPKAGNLFKELDRTDPKLSLRLPVSNWIEFISEYKIEFAPKYDNSVIFHSCPGCGQTDLYRNLVKSIYADYTKIPDFTSDFCGCTELLDRSNYDIRRKIARSFYEKNCLEKTEYIICSSFECIEHLNEFFTSSSLSIRAIHFFDALKSKN